MAVTTDQTSNLVINDNAIPNGNVELRTMPYSANATGTFTQQIATVSNGEISVPINEPAGANFLAVASTEGFPPAQLGTYTATSLGQNVVYANEVMWLPDGFISTTLTEVNNEALSTGLFQLPSGANFTIGSQGDVIYSSNGVYDYLDPGEFTTEAVAINDAGVLSTFDITVRASEEVGPKLIDPTVLTGTNWTKTGTDLFDTVYTATPANTDPLLAPCTMVQDKIYQIQIEVTGRTAGSVVPQIVGSTTNLPEKNYTLARNEIDVWQIRAPAAPVRVEVTRTSDFDGAVGKIFIRELICSDQVAVAEKIDVRQLDDLTTRINPLFIPAGGLIDDTLTPDRTFTGVLNNNAEFGVRITSQGTFTVRDATSVAKRAAVSTKGGDWALCWNVSVLGGYPEAAASWKFQTGFVFNDTTPFMTQTFVMHSDVDLFLPSMNGDYNFQNSDAIVLNGGDYTQRSYALNNRFTGVSDGIIDSKHVSFYNYGDFRGSWRILRNHTDTKFLACNLDLFQDTNVGAVTQAYIHTANYQTRNLVWNTYLDDFRMLDSSDMQTQGAYSTDTSSTTLSLTTIHVLKTQPRMPLANKVNLTEIEYEYKLNANPTWLEFSPKAEIMFHGDFRRDLALPAGTYDFRCRAINGEHTGVWTETTGVVIV